MLFSVRGFELATVACAVLLAALSLVTPATALQQGLTDLWPYSRALVYRHATLEDALQQPATHALVLVAGVDRPSRRVSSQPLLTFSPQAASHVPAAVQQLLTQCMQQLEQLGVIGGFALELDVLPAALQPGGQASGVAGVSTQLRPAAIFDVSTGRVLLSQGLIKTLSSSPVHVVSAAIEAAVAAVERVMQAAGKTMPKLEGLLRAAPAAATAGIAVTFIATVPKWFCFACPIVLGLLAPLVINAGVGEAADMACRAMKLPDDECVELWLTALGLGMILSLLSAIPIYKVCRLYECAHPGPNHTVTAAVAVA